VIKKFSNGTSVDGEVWQTLTLWGGADPTLDIVWL